MSWPFALGRAYEKLRLLISYCRAGDVTKAKLLFRSPEECPLCTVAGISFGEPECSRCLLTWFGRDPEQNCLTGKDSRIKLMVDALKQGDTAIAADIAGSLMAHIWSKGNQGGYAHGISMKPPEEYVNLHIHSGIVALAVSPSFAYLAPPYIPKAEREDPSQAVPASPVGSSCDRSNTSTPDL